ncbi:MAG: hypothetical protein Q9216_005650 [Gyalolechia sp. 2 TL-2023]
MEMFTRYRTRSAKIEHVQGSSYFQSLYESLIADQDRLQAGHVGLQQALPAAVAPAELQTVHRRWLDLETRCRLLVAAFVLDTQHGHLLQQNPSDPSILGGETDLTLPFPSFSDAWNCTDLSLWRDMIMSQQIFSLDTLDQDLPPLEPFQSSLRTCYQLRALRRLNNPTENDLTYHPTKAGSLATVLTYHALSLTRHTPLHALIITASESWLFGSKITDKEAWQQARLTLRSWVSSDAAMKAVWHATRLLRLSFRNQSQQAQEVDGPSYMHDLWCLYIAALVCWAFGYGAAGAMDVQGQWQAEHAENLAWEYLGAMDAQGWWKVSDVPAAARRSTRGLLECVRMKIGDVGLGGLLDGAEDSLFRLVDGESDMKEITMEDARPHNRESPQDGDKDPDEVATAPSADVDYSREMSADAQKMLRKVAQDASSQAEENAASIPYEHDHQSTSRAVHDHALVNGHAVPLATDPNDSINYGATNLEGLNIDGQTPKAPPVYSNHDDCDQSGLTNGSLDLTQANIEALVEDPTLEAATSVVESEPPRIQAFAKLEFDDGEFYMNTYSVELGRDIRAARQAYERDVQALQQVGPKLRKRSSSSGGVSHSSGKIKRGHRRHLSGSVVSESGGIMGLDHSDSDDKKPRGRRKSKSATSSSQQLSRKSSTNFPGTKTDYQSLAMASLLDPSMDAELVDPRTSLPTPESCPLVPIHPPASTDGVPTSHKSISRKHVKIAFNFEKHLFEVIVLGRNGAFVDEEWYPEGDVQPLRSGSLIQIGGVGIRFLLPDVALGETGAENTMGSDPASFDLEAEHAVNGGMGDSSDNENDEQDEEEDDESEDNSNDDKNEDSEESDEPSEEETRGRSRRRPGEIKPTVANRPIRNRKPVRGKEPTKAKSKAKAKTLPKAKQPTKAKPKAITKEEAKPDPVTPVPKRKGPGRPPKNGIISKREQALLARQAKEAARATEQSGPDARPGRGKGKSIAQPPDDGQEKGQLQPNGKRKYKKRKTKAEIEAAEQGEPQNVRESTEHTDSVPPDQNAAPPPKPPKPLRPPKPPRSPSPVFDEATLTPEQLAKPQSSYVVLIHDALSNSKTGQMSLPQIYRAIERKYPFYKLRVQTTGWQSSVRHNLSQHPAFRKIERDGKGWMWGLVPEVSIEKEKKRRTTPPPMPAQGYYPAPQTMQTAYPYPIAPPPNPQMPHPLYGAYLGLPPGQRPYAQFPTQTTASSLPPALANAQLDTSSTYQSPYATGPPPQHPDSPQPQQAASTNGLQSTSSPPPNVNHASAISTVNPPPPPTTSSHPQNTTTNNNRYIPAPSSSTSTPFQAPPPQSTSHTPDVLAVVKKFKDFLLSSMSDNPRAEDLIDSAINRVLNPSQNPVSLSSTASPSGEDDHQEKAIMRILQGMLDNMRAQKIKGEGEASGETRGGKMGNNSTFFQILESVSAQEGGTLPLPEAQMQTASMKKDMGERREGEEMKVESMSPDQDLGEKKAPSATPTPTEGPKGTKRRFEQDDDDGAMEARTLGAKRVAT